MISYIYIHTISVCSLRAYITYIFSLKRSKMRVNGVVVAAAATLFRASSLVGANEGLDLSDMPRSICGWPSLHDTGKFPEWNTRLAQYLLNYALNNSLILPTGKFTSLTTKEIETFQEMNSLTVNGYLNIDTWPTLTAFATPLQFGSSETILVRALQDALISNGYEEGLQINGVYDDSTKSQLAAFQLHYGAEITTGDVVDAQTWHLLTTQCSNNTTRPGYYWFDAGWPQGSISTETFSCLKDRGFEYTTIECWREKDGGSFVTDCATNVVNAFSAGFETVDVYMYADRYQDPTMQANQMLANLTSNMVSFRGVMLDVEGDKWGEYNVEENQQFMLSWRKVFDDLNIPMVMYCGSMWTSYFGNDFNAFADMPLVYAHYDNVPSFYDYDYAPFGGWEHASGKQFFDGIDPEIVCGLPLDWDWSPSQFWKE